jgi:hypothetical protein
MQGRLRIAVPVQALRTAVEYLLAGRRIPTATPAATPGAHADVVNPTYQIKLRLDPAATLTAATTPTAAVCATLQLSRGPERNAVQYLDTDALDLCAEGWLVRIKRNESARKFCLTFKKRYPANGDLRGVLDRAKDEGFDATDTNYDAQVDWSYHTWTLDLAADKKALADNDSGLEMPDDAASREMVLRTDKLPGKLGKWRANNWAATRLHDARVHGPVVESDYHGRFAGHDVQLQITPLHDRAGARYHYIEVTAEADDLPSAAALRDRLIATLDAAGWLLHEDAFKTDLVLQSY